MLTNFIRPNSLIHLYLLQDVLINCLRIAVFISYSGFPQTGKIRNYAWIFVVTGKFANFKPIQLLLRQYDLKVCLANYIYQ